MTSQLRCSDPSFLKICSFLDTKHNRVVNEKPDSVFKTGIDVSNIDDLSISRMVCCHPHESENSKQD
jgi:hypothetical protein